MAVLARSWNKLVPVYRCQRTRLHEGQPARRNYCLQALPKVKLKDGENNSDPELLQGVVLPRPVWYVFSGLGSQWNGLPAELWSYDPFSDSMRESRTTIRQLGLDLDELLSPGCDRIYKDIRSAFVSLAAVQIALYDTLVTLVNAPPGGFIGHSAGELLCAYADGCLSAEQVLVASDVRGRAMTEARSEPGAMAAISLPWREIQTRCPPGVYPACHNSARNVTVSGSFAAVHSFVSSVQEEGIFAKVVPSCGCSPHSPLVLESAELFREYLKEVIPGEGKLRSSSWICTSAPMDNWESGARFASGEYFVRNMLDQVWFHEGLQRVEKNAFVIEVSPKAIFQSILKQTLSSTDCLLFTPINKNMGVELGSLVSDRGNK